MFAGTYDTNDDLTGEIEVSFEGPAACASDTAGELEVRLADDSDSGTATMACPVRAGEPPFAVE
ncbi:MAG: hypothetical protein M3Y87_22100 [Myxococcota bacterium]|nr:hypothetical protein [Myxococcota bacterium]